MILLFVIDKNEFMFRNASPSSKGIYDYDESRKREKFVQIQAIYSIKCLDSKA